MRALLNATIYVSPTEEPIRGGTILVDGGRIAAVGKVAVPPNIETIDCSGCTITAGFCNSHVHFFERKWADAGNIPAPELTRQLQDTFTRFGFTSVFDLSSMCQNTRRIRDRIESALTKFAQGTRAVDDITLVIVKRQAESKLAVAGV